MTFVGVMRKHSASPLTTPICRYRRSGFDGIFHKSKSTNLQADAGRQMAQERVDVWFNKELSTRSRNHHRFGNVSIRVFALTNLEELFRSLMLLARRPEDSFLESWMMCTDEDETTQLG
jgi:hypothetical protein